MLVRQSKPRSFKNQLEVNNNPQKFPVLKSINEKHIKKLENTKQNFQDDTFPPNMISIIGEYDQKRRFEHVTWKRITDLFRDAKIISDRIQPNDIRQGMVGNCYFLAAIASLAEKQDRIKHLFSNYSSISQNNSFSVKMIYQGKWVLIDLDQWFPVFMQKELAFAKSVESELWAIILEKAWAKLYTSYLRTEGGFPQQTLHDLTGAPCRTIMLNKHVYQESWNYLWDASLREYAMVAASNSGKDNVLSIAGIAQGHAYTVLNATLLRIGRDYVKMVQLRNPWGNTEAKSSMGDTSQIWNEVSEEQKKRIGYLNRDPNDGIFFMLYDNFVKEFAWVQVAQVEDRASYTYLSTVDPALKGVYYRIKIAKKGVYSLQVDKPPMRGYPHKIQSFYSYPLTQIIIAESENGKWYQNDRIIDNQRTTFIKKQLNVGTYIIKVLVKYDRRIQTDFFINLAIYSTNQCQIEWASQQQASKIEGGEVSWDGRPQDKNREPQWHKGGNMEYIIKQGRWKYYK